MAAIRDFSKEKIGRLQPLYIDETKPRGKGHNIYWICQCDCGNEVIVYGGHLANGHTKTCGCIRPPRKDLLNQKFGRLTAIEWIGQGKWRCQCDCGNIVDVKSGNLISGNTTSCGCYQSQRASEARFKSLVNQRFGRLTILERVENNKFGHVCYRCRCDCGTEVIVDATNLRNGNTNSCGCYKNELTKQRNTIDLTGQRFGKLLVIEKTEQRSDGSVMWKCQCDCGAIKIINGSSLRQGLTRSCGCGTISIGEENILKILDTHQIPYLYNEAYFADLYTGKGKGRYDFVLYPHTSQIRLVEFDGEQHFKEWTLSQENLAERQRRDQIKNHYAIQHNIPLVRIPYWERDNITLEMILGDQYLITQEVEL